jgi:hypothetical protein
MTRIAWMRALFWAAALALAVSSWLEACELVARLLHGGGR